MKGLKRCVIVTRFARNQPGYLDFAYRVESLARKYDVTLLSDYPLTVPEMQIDGVAHVILPGGESYRKWLLYLWNSALFIRRARPDFVILLHTLTVPAVHFLHGIPCALYWNEHSIRFKSTKPVGPLKRVLRNIKHYLVFELPTRRVHTLMPIGEAHRDDLILQGCSAERVKLIYMGVDDRFAGVAMQRRRLEVDAPLELIYTGTVQRERGRDVMLEAVAKASSAGIPLRLTLVGARPEEQDYCRNLADRLGIERHIVVHGRVPGSEIPTFLMNADAGICIWEDRPWWRFNPPTKLFEYMVAGLPTLASNIRTHTQYIRHGENGLIFEYNSDSLAEAIGELWRSRSKLSAMKQNALQSGRPYLWNNIEPVFLEAVANLMGT
jgi:glycosyltransferase involved in cell wall biosynthesis